MYYHKYLVLYYVLNVYSNFVLKSHHVSSDLVLSIQFLQVFLWSLLMRVGSQVGLNQVVHNVVFADTLNTITTLDGEKQRKRKPC